MPLKEIGGWWHVRFTHKGKRYDINTMERGDSGRAKAEVYEFRFRSYLQSHNVSPVAAAVSGECRHSSPELCSECRQSLTQVRDGVKQCEYVRCRRFGIGVYDDPIEAKALELRRETALNHKNPCEGGHGEGGEKPSNRESTV